MVINEFKNMKKKDAEPKVYSRNNNHSFMTARDRPLSERLTHDKIIKNFEVFTARGRFQNMDPILRKLFYEGAAKIISQAIESDNER